MMVRNHKPMTNPLIEELRRLKQQLRAAQSAARHFEREAQETERRMLQVAANAMTIDWTARTARCPSRTDDGVSYDLGWWFGADGIHLRCKCQASDACWHKRVLAVRLRARGLMR